MKSWVSSNEGGGLVTQPLVSANDHGLTVGDGIFETLKTINGKAVLLERHLARLQRSAQLLDLLIPSLDEIRIAISQLLAQEEIVKSAIGRIRITLTSGPGELGSIRSNGWTLIVVWSESKPWPDSAEVVISDIVRNERSPLAGAKTISYAENVLALSRAKKVAASEAILLNLAGNVCEGTGSNIFIVKNKVVLTPPVIDGLLPGITRNAVIESIPKQIRFSELSFTAEDLLNADEVFLTSTTRNIQPVTKINDKTFPIGSVTKELQVNFSKWMEENDG
jgi:branched-chain amino acid aminotransferase